MNETDKKVDEALLQWGIAYATHYAGETKKWEDQTVDHYRVKIGTFETDFYQGLGNRKPVKGAPKPGASSEWSGKFGRRQWEIRFLRPVAPSAASVLYCLLSDATAMDQCFVDWADEYGYDTDSRKALATYEACCETGQALRKVFTHAQRDELRELLQDY